MKKYLSLFLALMLVCSFCVMPTFATTDVSKGTQVVYDASQDENNPGEAYTVTVPAKMAPGETATVSANGTWASNRQLTVTADATVILTNDLSADTKELTVTFDGIELGGSNTAAVSAEATISVADIENALFGTWSGTINYDVEMVEMVDIDDGEAPAVS